MGFSQSMQSLAMTISPILGGIADQVYIYFPFLIASLAAFFASLVYLKAKIE